MKNDDGHHYHLSDRLNLHPQYLLLPYSQRRLCNGAVKNLSLALNPNNSIMHLMQVT